VLTLVTVSPSLLEMITQDLSPLVVLARLVESFALAGVLVVGASAVALRYARPPVDDVRPGADEES
jgi:hypothetical protein